MRSSIAVLALLMAMAFVLPSSASAKGKSTPAHNKATVKKAYGWFNTNNWDSLATIIAPDYVEHDPDQGQGPGFEGLKAQFKQYMTTFPDMKMEAKEVVAEGDMVLARVLITGTMKGAMGNMPANNKKMEVEMFEQIRLKDGKAVERWGVFDTMKMMAQLGLMPPPDAPKEGKK
jgi:steroid delta-isomerase-like uncharacterized protein